MKETDIFVGKIEAGDTYQETHEKAITFMMNMVKEQYGIEVSHEENPISVEEGGKPFLTHHKEIFYNISHSGKWIICVVGKVPMGIDIQYKKDANYEKIGKRILSKQEFAELKEAENKRDRFYYFWTKKESYVKYTGEGIRMELGKLAYEGCRFYHWMLGEEYQLALCVPETWRGTIIK